MKRITMFRSAVHGLGRLLRWILVLPFLYPFVWMLVGASWPDSQPLSSWLEQRFVPDFSNFATLAETIPLAQLFLNSVQVVVLAIPLSLLVGSWAGFALSQLSPRQQRWGIALSIGALLTPPTALWLARFPLFRLLGWIDTPLPLIAPALIGGSPFFVLLLHHAYRRIPTERIEAAALDGASPWQIWHRVALPAVRGTTGAVAILNFLYFWNNFTDPLLYVRSVEQLTLPVGVRLLAQMDESHWPLLMAGSLVLALPPALAFVLGQRLLRDIAVTLR